MTFLVDSHCHLGSLEYPNKTSSSIDETLSRAHKCGVTHILSVACMPSDFNEMIERIKGFDGIFTACGIHPLNIEDAKGWTDDELKDCLKHESVIALGETGLDYFYAEDTKEVQISDFVRQIALARELKLPLILHAREAHKDTVSLMRSENARDVGGVMHCFCDSIEMARECLDLGFYISFSGISTFKQGDNVRDVVKYVPRDRMLVETDSPYLAPIPVRGYSNEPCFVRYTLEFIADFLGVSSKILAETTSHNFENLFNVKLQDISFANDVESSNNKIESLINRPL